MSEPTPNPPRGSSQLVFGICLLAFGAVLLASNLGYIIPLDLRQHWPIPLLLFGLVGLIFPSRHLSRSGGMWLFVIGLYGEVCIHRVLGLGWGSAWPLFLIASGLSIIMNRGRRRRRDSQVSHEA